MTTAQGPVTDASDETATTEKLFTQAEVNQLIAARVSRYSDYKDLQAKAAELVSVAAERDEALAKLAQMETQAQVKQWSAAAAAEFGVPEALLRGSTEDELKEHAKALAEVLKPQGAETGQADSQAAAPILRGLGQSPEAPVVPQGASTLEMMLGVTPT